MQALKSSRSRAAALSLALLLGVSLTAEARVGSSPSRSSSATASAPRATAPASRVGGGQSMGMQRSSVMDAVRSRPAPAPAAAPMMAPRAPMMQQSAPRVSSPVPAQAPAPVAKKDRSWVAPAAVGALAGAAATYALADHGNHQAAPQQPQQYASPQQQYVPQQQQQYVPQQQPVQPYVQQPVQQYAPAPVANGGYAAAPQYAPQYAPASAPKESSGGFMGFVLVMALLGLGYFMYRKSKSSAPVGRSQGSSPSFAAPASKPVSYDTDEEAMAKKFFNELQELNNKGNLVRIKEMTTSDLYAVLEHDIQTRSGESRTSVVSLNAEVVANDREGDRDVMSVRFTGLVSESSDLPPDAIDEVWHFVQEPNQAWRLAGIEQV